MRLRSVVQLPQPRSKKYVSQFPGFETNEQVKRQLAMGHPQLRLLYTTPETLFSKQYEDAFKRCHRQGQLVRLVIDEVSNHRSAVHNDLADMLQAHVIDVSWTISSSTVMRNCKLTVAGLGLGVSTCKCNTD